jgi:DNA uptake protein ComE-like DNA-binding protein
MLMKFLRLIAASLAIAALSAIAPSTFAHAQTKPDAKKAAPASKGAASSKAAKVDLLDINKATKAELTALPGIGDAYSQKIIDGRPYARKDQLVSKNIIPQATYDKIKDQIIASQPPAKKK